MTGVHIRKRVTKGGERRYDVRYRRGGRGYPVEHGGTFKREADAKERLKLVAGELAAGRDPKDALRPKPPSAERTGKFIAEAYKASRIDLVDFPDGHLYRFVDFFGDRVLEDQTWADVQAWVNKNTDLKPSSLKKYLQTVKLIFDFADLDVNPARDRRVRLPRVVHEEIVPPTGKQVLALLDRLARRTRLAVVTMEQTGMTIGEIVSLAWGDVDVAGNQFRLKRANVKGQIASRARWVQVPAWLMELVADTCPLEDRTIARQVFQRLTDNKVRADMTSACQEAGIPHFSPHDLRHRRISLWHGQGIPARQLADRAGHSKASMSLDLYSHVMPDDEIAQNLLLTALEVSRP